MAIRFENKSNDLINNEPIMEHSLWHNISKIEDFYFKEFSFQRINTLERLKEVAERLNVCSGVRTDLVNGFLEGKIIRFEIKKGRDICGIVALMPEEREVRTYPFKFYALTFRHNYVKDSAHEIMDGLVESFESFKEEIISKEIEYSGQKLKRGNYFTF